MRRALIGFAVAALAVVSLAVPASAARGQVTHYRFRGVFVNAAWSVGPESSGTITDLTVSRSSEASELSFFRQATNVAPDGTVTYTETTARATSGFTFTIDKVGLDSASVSGSALPATTCTYDADFNEIGCQPGTLGLTADWAGQGAIGRLVLNQHLKMGELSMRQHLQGTMRDGTATGTFTGDFGTDTLGAGELNFAELGTTRSGETTLCIGGGNC